MTKREHSTGLSYRDAGVDIDAGNALVDKIGRRVGETRTGGVLTGLGGFGGLFALDLERFPEPVLVSGTDGVGTKLLLARQLDRHDTIGIDLVAMCVNDIVVTGAEPLFFLDYYATGQLDVDAAADVISGIATGCEQAGCALIGGETAEMPGVYNGNDYHLAGFAVGAVSRPNIIDGAAITPGDQVLGLASSGPHSNGYSLIRAVLDRSGVGLDAECGRQRLGEALLAPTRIYVEALKRLFDQHRPKGLAHVTGGGLIDNLPRVLPEGLGITIDAARWPHAPVFDWLQSAGAIESMEMYRTFNCGVGMVIIVDADQAADTAAVLTDAGEQVYTIGEVTEREGVVITGSPWA